MIVPVSQGGASSFAQISGGTNENTQLMAVQSLHSRGELGPQSAEPAPQSHKSIKDQLKDLLV